MLDILSCVGLHWILKYGSILNTPRSLICRIKLFDELFKCSLCLGFWTGVVVYFVEQQYVLLPFVSAAACWFMDNLNNTIQRAEIKLEKDV